MQRVPRVITTSAVLKCWLRRLRAGLFVFACIVCAAASAEAQTGSVMIGFTRSTMAMGTIPTDSSGADAAIVSHYGGGLFGVSIGTDTTRPASIAVEGLFVVRGVRLGTAAGVSANNLKYLEAPVLGRFSAGRIGPIPLHVLAGPTFAFRFGGSDTITGTSVNDLVRRFDSGLMVGMGFEVRGYLVQARYEWGLVNVSRNGGLLGTGTMKNRTLALLVAVPMR